MPNGDRYSYATELACVGCDRRFGLDDGVFTCPGCGPLAGTLDVRYDLTSLTRPAAGRARRGGRRAFDWSSLQDREASIWRYHELLPVADPEAVLDLPTGMTPLMPLSAGHGFDLAGRVWVKDDTRAASGSSKDRATAVALSRARQRGFARVAAASTGNAAASLACYAARAGLACVVFAPAGAPAAKLLQIRSYGAHLLAIDGSYDDAFDLCAAYCERTGTYNRNTASNPFLGEGKKTLALEIWDQLGGKAPDWVVVPVGDGCILGGVHKGFADLRGAGLIGALPRLLGVQAEGSAALAHAWRAGAERCAPVDARTVADSLAVDCPRDQRKALRAVRESRGAFVTVSDDSILASQAALASRAGLLVEPAAAAPLAGWQAALRDGTAVAEDDTQIVLLHTGHGLKDVGALERAAAFHPPLAVPPDLGRILAALEQREEAP